MNYWTGMYMYNYFELDIDICRKLIFKCFMNKKSKPSWEREQLGCDDKQGITHFRTK